jgi:hypothetical protein
MVMRKRVASRLTRCSGDHDPCALPRRSPRRLSLHVAGLCTLAQQKLVAVRRHALLERRAPCVPGTRRVSIVAAPRPLDGTGPDPRSLITPLPGPRAFEGQHRLVAFELGTRYVSSGSL